MENTFDFNQVGKRMPYKVPDAFFDKMMEGLPNPSEGGANLRFQKPLLRGSWGMGGSSSLLRLRATLLPSGGRRGWGRLLLAAAAAVALFFVVQPLLPKSSTDDFENVELAFNNLSTDDQDFLLEIYEEDDFMNDSNDI